MNVRAQKSSTPHALQWNRYDLAFCGEVLDDRGNAVTNELNQRANQKLSLRYDPVNLEMIVDGARVEADAFTDLLKRQLLNSIILEATTLGFVEILLCCRALRNLAIRSFEIVYVEPESYRNMQPSHILHRRDFELSGDVPGYQAIPGYAILLGERKVQKGVFFVGYEEARLRRAFEDLQMIQPSNAAVTFGVPAFKPGWEMDSLANNIAVIREQNIRGGIHFCGAENPIMVIEMLTDIHESVAANERMFIAPIGTKPHGIGVALFVSCHPHVGLIYDHPRRSHGRTDQIANWHLYSVKDF